MGHLERLRMMVDALRDGLVPEVHAAMIAECEALGAALDRAEDAAGVVTPASLFE